MNKEKVRKILLILGITLLVIYIVVMIFEISNFSPYNTRIFLFFDRALEFLFPSILCFVIREFLKKKK